MQDHPGFNGFAQPHFIGQQHARRMAATHVMGDVQLVRNQVRTLPTQAAPRHAVLLTLVFPRAVAQRETVHTINLPGEKTILRLAEHQLAVEQHFTQHHVALTGIKTRTGIGEQTVLFVDFIDGELPAVVTGDGVTGIEHDARDGRVAAGIQAIFTGGGEKQGDRARVHRNDSTKSKLAFRIADPALTKCKGHK